MVTFRGLDGLRPMKGIRGAKTWLPFAQVGYWSVVFKSPAKEKTPEFSLKAQSGQNL